MSATVKFPVNQRSLPPTGSMDAFFCIRCPGMVYRNVQISVRYAAFKRHPE